MSDVSILDKIVATKRKEVAALRATPRFRADRFDRSAAELEPIRDFSKALRLCAPAVIAEIKRASPSQGVIRARFQPVEIAASYAEHGAACLSVLTDTGYFGGSRQDLRNVRASSVLPILRKDFIIDRCQLVESRVLGADCILLIVAILDDASLADLYEFALQLGFEVLLEVHDSAELERALALEPVPTLIGINNRDLRTFRTDLRTTAKLLSQIPKSVAVVSESGIRTQEDVAFLTKLGVAGFLVGETFMRASSPGSELERLFGPVVQNGGSRT